MCTKNSFVIQLKLFHLNDIALSFCLCCAQKQFILEHVIMSSFIEIFICINVQIVHLILMHRLYETLQSDFVHSYTSFSSILIHG